LGRPITLGKKGFQMTNTLAYSEHSQSTKNVNTSPVV